MPLITGLSLFVHKLSNKLSWLSLFKKLSFSKPALSRSSLFTDLLALSILLALQSLSLSERTDVSSLSPPLTASAAAAFELGRRGKTSLVEGRIEFLTEDWVWGGWIRLCERD